MKKILLITLFALLCKLIYAQVIQQEFPKATPPVVYNFIKYGDIPVSESSGAIGISIPIYTIKHDGFEFPLQLTYHSGGHKVVEEASWVGLGWDLKIGNVVQMVQGENDLEFPVYLPDYHASILMAEMNETLASTGSQPISSPYYGFYGFWSHKYPKNGSMDDWEDELHGNSPISDMEPDIFIANFNGHSLKFLIDPDNTNNYVVLDKRGYKIGRSSNNGWVITDAQGVQYYFDELNQSQINSYTSGKVSYSKAFPDADFSSDIQTGGSPKHYNSNTWQLTKIITKVGREINFQYSGNVTISAESISYQWDLSKVTSVTSHDQPPTYGPIDFLYGSFPRGDAPIGQVSCSKENTATEISYLTAIEFNGGNSILDFDLTNRLDINNAKKIQSITLSHNNIPLKSFVFNYDYYVSDYTGCGYVCNKSQTELTHRLKLESFKEQGKPSYQFNYDLTKLPPKNSFAQDYWGYYNGMLNNNSILPNVKRLRYSPDITMNLPSYFMDLISYNTTNNSADLTYAKASVLEEIIYPTGGKTVFDFDLNSLSNQILPDKNYDEIPISEQISISSNSATSNNNDKGGFSIPNSSTVSCTGHVTMNCYDKAANLDNVFARIFMLSIVHKDEYESNNTLFWQKFNSGVYEKEQVYERVLKLENDVITKVPEDDNFVLELSPSNFYVAVVQTDPNYGVYPPTIMVSMLINIDGSYLPEFNQTESHGNGLRVKSITNYSGNEFVNKKVYTYEEGKVPLPRVFYKDWRISDYHEDLVVDCYNYNIFQFKTSSFITVNPIGAGNGVYYSKVTISDVNEQGIPNGRVEKYFTSLPDEYHAANPSNYVWGVSLPSFRTGFNNGLLTSEKIYDTEGLIKSIKYDYLTKTYDKFYGARYKFLGSYHNPSGYGIFTGGNHSNGMFSFYPIFKTETLLEKKITTSKLEGLDVITEEEITYTDDNLIRNQNFIQSDGRETGNTYFYPDDVPSISELSSSESSIITQLNKQNQHRIGEVIKISSYTGQNTTKEVIRTYNNFEGNTLPASVKVAYDSDLFIDEAVFDKYDTKGNLLKYHKQDDIYNYYIWSYNSQYPVAQIQTANASSSIISSIQSCVDGLSLSNSDDYSSINEDIGKLKGCLSTVPDNSGYMVTYYTYKPLVGMTSQTDPSGKTTYYEYDAFGRLETIKDQDGKMLKHIEYNYANGN